MPEGASPTESRRARDSVVRNPGDPDGGRAQRIRHRVFPVASIIPFLQGPLRRAARECAGEAEHNPVLPSPNLPKNLPLFFQTHSMYLNDNTSTDAPASKHPGNQPHIHMNLGVFA